MLRRGATRAAAKHAVNEAPGIGPSSSGAKGILMVTYRIDADIAFELQRHHSQNTNTKKQPAVSNVRPAGTAQLSNTPLARLRRDRWAGLVATVVIAHPVGGTSSSSSRDRCRQRQEVARR